MCEHWGRNKKKKKLFRGSSHTHTHIDVDFIYKKKNFSSKHYKIYHVLYIYHVENNIRVLSI